jgi:hypothetical protein
VKLGPRAIRGEVYLQPLQKLSCAGPPCSPNSSQQDSARFASEGTLWLQWRENTDAEVKRIILSVTNSECPEANTGNWSPGFMRPVPKYKRLLCGHGDLTDLLYQVEC